MYPVVSCWVKCLKNHNVITMYPLDTCTLAPSEHSSLNQGALAFRDPCIGDRVGMANGTAGEHRGKHGPTNSRDGLGVEKVHRGSDRWLDLERMSGIGRTLLSGKQKGRGGLLRVLCSYNTRAPHQIQRYPPPVPSPSKIKPSASGSRAGFQPTHHSLRRNQEARRTVTSERDGGELWQMKT